MRKVSITKSDRWNQLVTFEASYVSSTGSGRSVKVSPTLGPFGGLICTVGLASEKLPLEKIPPRCSCSLDMVGEIVGNFWQKDDNNPRNCKKNWPNDFYCKQNTLLSSLILLSCRLRSSEPRCALVGVGTESAPWQRFNPCGCCNPTYPG